MSKLHAHKPHKPVYESKWCGRCDSPMVRLRGRLVCECDDDDEQDYMAPEHGKGTPWPTPT